MKTKKLFIATREFHVYASFTDENPWQMLKPGDVFFHTGVKMLDDCNDWERPIEMFQIVTQYGVMWISKGIFNTATSKE